MGFFSRSNSVASRRNHSAQSTNDSRAASPSQSQPRSSIGSASQLDNAGYEPKSHRRRWFGSKSGSRSSTPLPRDPGSPAGQISTSSKDASASTDSGSATPTPHGRTLYRGRTPSKLSISSMLDDVSKQAPIFSHSHTRSRSRQDALTPPSPRTISSPTAFQHMTHVELEQYAKLSSANGSDLAADFSALRASQSLCRNFRGIKVADIHSRNSSVETTSNSISASDGSSNRFSAATSATNSTRNSAQSMEPHDYQCKSHVRAKRSQDSFSRPFLNGRPPKFVTAPPPAPPRMSSKKAGTRYELLQQQQEQEEMLLAEGFEANRTLESIDEGRGPPTRENKLHEDEDDSAYLTPGEKSWQNGRWPLSAYGQTLQAVDEEASAGAGSHRDTIVYSPRQTSTVEPISSGSSSEESSATVTAVSYAKTLRYRSIHPTSSEPPNTISRVGRSIDKRISMKRSSINNGLFTGWAVEDGEDDDAQAARETPDKAMVRLTALPKIPPRLEKVEKSKRGSSTRSKLLDPAERPFNRLLVKSSAEKHKKHHRSSTGSSKSHESRPRSSHKEAASKSSLSSRHSRHTSEPLLSTIDSKLSRKRDSAN